MIESVTGGTKTPQIISVYFIIIHYDYEIMHCYHSILFYDFILALIQCELCLV